MRILLFSSVTVKTPTKLIFIFFAYYFLAVLRIRDVYPGSRIQKQQQKTGVKKNFFVKPFFVATNFTKLNIILFLICLRKKFDPIFQELLNFLPKKLSPSPQKYGFGIRDPKSRIWKKPIPDPGSRGQKGTGSRSRIRNTAL